MFSIEQISIRLKCFYVGIAMGIAVWLLFTSATVFSSLAEKRTTMSSSVMQLTPIHQQIK